MNFGVIEIVKCRTVGWFDHLGRTGGNEITGRIHMSEVDAVGIGFFLEYDDKC